MLFCARRNQNLQIIQVNTSTILDWLIKIRYFILIPFSKFEFVWIYTSFIPLFFDICWSLFIQEINSGAWFPKVIALGNLWGGFYIFLLRLFCSNNFNDFISFSFQGWSLDNEFKLNICLLDLWNSLFKWIFYLFKHSFHSFYGSRTLH